jgi:hypothetical protein
MIDCSRLRGDSHPSLTSLIPELLESLGDATLLTTGLKILHKITVFSQLNSSLCIIEGFIKYQSFIKDIYFAKSSIISIKLLILVSIFWLIVVPVSFIEVSGYKQPIQITNNEQPTISLGL